MLDFIQQLFREYNFDNNINDDRFYFFQKDESNLTEFYIIDLVDQSVLDAYLDSESLTDLLSFFNEQKPKSPAVDKNTNLLIFVKVNTVTEETYDRLKRHIWKIEEDEYFFNKSVILYDQNSLNELSSDTDIKVQLTNNILKIDDFTNYSKNQFIDSAYFFTIQLFIKLSFLEIPVKYEEFKDLQALISSKLNKNENYLVDALSENELKKFKKLRDDCLNISDDSFELFLNKFNG